MSTERRHVAISGWYTIGDQKVYLRSKYEVSYARYLQFLLEKKKILKWEYEPDTFWFEKIKRGVRSYLPDFKITNLDKSIEYHEVKGFMDSRSATKLRRMAQYYPGVVMILIDKDAIKSIRKWESMYPPAFAEV